MLMLVIKIAATLAVTFAAGTLTDRMGIESIVPVTLAFWGAVSFFLGPYATGSGFFVRGGFFVNSATPAWIWRGAGIIMWAIGGVVLYSLAGEATG